MIALRIIAGLIALASSLIAVADTEDPDNLEDDGLPTTVFCSDCRNLQLHPIDGANYALNQAWGPGSWMSAEEADKFYVRDRYGNSYSVDLNLALKLTWYPIAYVNLPYIRAVLPWPSDLQLQIIMRNRNWQIVWQDKMRPHEVPWPLPVGYDSTEPGSGSGEGFDGDDLSEYEVTDDGDDWFVDDDIGGELCTSCTAAFDADFDGEFDTDDDGDLIEYEL